MTELSSLEVDIKANIAPIIMELSKNLEVIREQVEMLQITTDDAQESGRLTAILGAVKEMGILLKGTMQAEVVK